MRIDGDVHHRLRVMAAERDLPLYQFIDEVLRRAAEDPRAFPVSRS